MKNDIENQAKGYQDLIDEVEKDQEKINEHIVYLLTGIVGAKELSDQEYEVFINRTLYNNKFEDIACNMQIRESTAKTYYGRALNKLQATAKRISIKHENK